MSNNVNIVAPSFDIVCPYYVYNILSIPHGPNVVFKISATA